MPIVSNNPKDHHSLLQLYLDGPRDKLFYVFSDNEKDKKKINTKKFKKEIHFLENKTLSSIKSFQKNAFIKTISKKIFLLENLYLKNLTKRLLVNYLYIFIRDNYNRQINRG